jgi:hypothetical protein
LECSVLAPFWAKYTLIEGSGSCASYEGDFIDAQRYLAPGATSATVAVATGRMTTATRTLVNDELPRFALNEDAGAYTKESAIGTFTSLTPVGGVCELASFVASDQDLPPVSYEVPLSDGGTRTETEPGIHIKEEWADFKIINNARFTSTVVSATLTVTEDECTAKYQVDALHPVVACTLDEECNPEANPNAGRSAGSGLQAAFFKDGIPKCTHFTNHPDGYETSYLAEVPAVWVPGSGYPVGTRVTTAGGAYVATAYGVSSDAYEGPAGTADAIPDGTVSWKYIGAEAEAFPGDLAPFASLATWKRAAVWHHATSYARTRPMRVINGFGLYQLVSGGVSGDSGPTGRGEEIADGTAIWTYVSAADPANPPAFARLWKPSTTYETTFPLRVTNGGGTYEVVTAGISGGGPTGTGDAIEDGTAKWMYVNAVSRTARYYFPKGVCAPTVSFADLAALK